MQANKNGFFYVLDRVTGELISAEAFVPVSWATGIDMKTGRPIVVPEAYYTSTQGVTVAPVQGHGASPMAFSPITGLVYFPGNANSTFSFTADGRLPVHTGESDLWAEHGSGRGAACGSTGDDRPGSTNAGGARPGNVVGVESGDAEGTLVCAWWRLERRRSARDGWQSRVSSPQ